MKAGRGREETGEEKEEEMVVISRDGGVNRNDSRDRKLKVLDEDYFYRLTLTKGGPALDLQQEPSKKEFFELFADYFLS